MNALTAVQNNAVDSGHDYSEVAIYTNKVNISDLNYKKKFFKSGIS